MPKPPPKPRPVEDADVLPNFALLVLAFVLGILAAGLLMCLMATDAEKGRASAPPSVLHGVVLTGSRAWLQALPPAPPTMSERGHGR